MARPIIITIFAKSGPSRSQQRSMTAENYILCDGAQFVCNPLVDYLVTSTPKGGVRQG